MKRYGVSVVAFLLAATVAFSLGVGVKPVKVPPPIDLVDEAGGSAGEGAGERRTRASGAAAQRGARVRGDRRRSRSRPTASARGGADGVTSASSDDREDDADTDDEQADRDDAANEPGD